jgi:surfeit locus 1 family protein
MMTDMPRRFPIGLTVATVISLAILASLGTWQLQRLAWKQALLAQIATLKDAPAQDLAPVLARMARGEELGFTRVKVNCPGLSAAPYLELYGLKDGAAGVRLISACATPGTAYGAILIDRGFVSDSISARPPVTPGDATTVQLIGVLRSPDKATFVTPPNRPEANHWYSRDVGAMARTLGVTRPAPMFLMAETSTNPAWAALQPSPIPAEISNRHLEYALTWFGLAGALIAVYAAMLWKRLRGGRPPE